MNQVNDALCACDELLQANDYFWSKCWMFILFFKYFKDFDDNTYIKAIQLMLCNAS